MAELLANNKVIVFLKKSEDRSQFDKVLTQANAISYMIVDLEKDAALASVFSEKESCLFVDGKRAGDWNELEKMAQDATLAQVLPLGFVKETLD
jgi:hypothetical protein